MYPYSPETTGTTVVPVLTSTSTLTGTAVSTGIATNTWVITNTFTPTNTWTNTIAATNTNTNTQVATSSFTATDTPGNTSTNTNVPTYTNTITSTSTNTNTFTETVTGTQPATWTPTNTGTNTAITTYTPTGTPTQTNTITQSNTATNTATDTQVATNTGTDTQTSTRTNTATDTLTYTSTSTWTNTPSSTATPSFTNTPAATNTVTSGPTFTGTMIDNFEDGDVNLTLRGAAWATWPQGSGSTISKQAVTDPGAGIYSCRISGNVVGSASEYPSITLLTDLNAAGTVEDHKATAGLRIYMKGNYGSGTQVMFLIMLISTNITDYSYWRYTYTPTANWQYVEIPWSSFTAPSWGQGAGVTRDSVLQNLKGLEWVIADATGANANSTGNNWYIDEIEIYSTATPTNTNTPSYTITPGGPTLTFTPTVTYTPNDADDPNIQYFGRWDFSNPKVPVANWGPVYIKVKFEGTSIAIRMVDEQVDLGAEGKGNYYQYRIDGGALTILPSTSASVYTLATGLSDTTHTLEFYRRSESKYGKTTFYGFSLDSGKRLVTPDPRSSRKIEVLGDSISSSLAVENNGWYNNTSNNGYNCFGPQLARMVNAEWRVQARGGGTFYSDTWLPMREFFKRTFGPYNLEHNPSPSNPYWDFNSWKPDVFFLELGTNDFSEQYPHIDQTLYVNKYKDFLTYLRSVYPDAYICCIPPFKEGTPWDEPRAYIPIAVSQMADAKIHCVSLYGLLIHPTDYVTGDEYHPNVGGHTKIANFLYINYIQPVVGW